MKGAGKFELVYTPADGGKPTVHHVYDYPKGGGVGLGMYNTTEVTPVHLQPERAGFESRR